MTTVIKLQLVAKDTVNQETRTTIGYVNPNSANATLKEFCQRLNGLTNNTFQSVVKITTTDITDAEG